MELNRERIIKELEGLATFVTCPEYIKNALALIKELTEENEAWQKQLISEKEKADKAYYELACEVENLRSENERSAKRILEADKKVVSQREEIRRLQNRIHTLKRSRYNHQEKAKRFEKRLRKALKKNLKLKAKGGWISVEDIDQIAKEMEGDTK